ncbi:hypothetical protein M8494_05430 [Serratia ureilytica]
MKRRATRNGSSRRSGKTGDGQRARRYAANLPACGWTQKHIGIGQPAVFTARQALSMTAIRAGIAGMGFPQAAIHGGPVVAYAPNQYLPPKLRVFYSSRRRLAGRPQLKRLRSVMLMVRPHQRVIAFLDRRDAVKQSRDGRPHHHVADAPAGCAAPGRCVAGRRTGNTASARSDTETIGAPKSCSMLS